MFTIEDTSRSLTVHRENRGYAIVSYQDGCVYHRTGLSFDDAYAIRCLLNRAADIAPGQPPTVVYAFVCGTLHDILIAAEDARAALGEPEAEDPRAALAGNIAEDEDRFRTDGSAIV